MKPIRTVNTNFTFRLAGGTAANDLPCQREDDYTISVWKPTDEERAKIAAGENLSLCIWGSGHPPVSLTTTDEEQA